MKPVTDIHHRVGIAEKVFQVSAPDWTVQASKLFVQ